ncbi:MAG: pyridoxamine 5'-phosphate oxidase family protein [Bacteroidetes bacterium]|nr:pyridoxamine 5'-phosphate oxidase family protein [Bacteroidota bacterium]
MDSINKNQPEHNLQHLTNKDAVEKIKELIKKSSTCFFTTAAATGQSAGTRPMAVQKTDDEGNLWFLSAKDSHKNMEISMSPLVKLYFQGSPHSDFLFLEGSAVITDNKQIIKELWEPLLKVWFTEGENDPRISVIKFTPAKGYYWDNKHGNAIAGIKIMISAAIGKTLDDSIEGKIII